MCFSSVSLLIALLLIAHGCSRKGDVTSLSPPDVYVTTLAGNVSYDGTGVSAGFHYPGAVTFDGAGNLYVADTYNNTIRKIVISTGDVTTLAGNGQDSHGSADGTGEAARFYLPSGITTDGTNLYVADTWNCKIRKIVISTGVVTTLAGRSCSYYPQYAEGVGTEASFYYPSGITTDGTNLYVTDTSNNRIRKIVISTGEVTTLAGTGLPGSVDGEGTTASFNYPSGITTDGANLYVADTLNNAIRKIVISTGVVTALAGGYGFANGTGTAARFARPEGIATDGTNLYVADTLNNAIRKIVVSTGEVTTLAGAPGYVSEYYSFADGTGTAARFTHPRGITTDGQNLYVADTENNTIRLIVISSGVVTTPVGAPPFMDGTGAAARFFRPYAITTDGTNLYVADTENDTIRKIVISTGKVTTLAGSIQTPHGFTDGTGTSASFSLPRGITTDGVNLYIADGGSNRIRKIVIATGEATTLLVISEPFGITTDGTNLYIASYRNCIISKVVISTGIVTTVAGAVNTEGFADGIGSNARFYSLTGIANDGTNLYVTDLHKIRKIVLSTGEVTTLAGSPVQVPGSADGIGTEARFDSPYGITTDGINLYVADTGNSTIRKIVISTGKVTTLAGSADIVGFADGTGVAARFAGPSGITTDGTNLYVSDIFNNTIRKIQ